MKKTTTILFIIILFCLQSYSQVTKEWAETFDGASKGNDGGISTYIDAGGNVYTAGYTAVDDRYDCIVIKYNANGVQQWMQTYNNATNMDATGRGITGDADGNIIVTGNILVGNGYDAFTMKYDSSGNQLWVQTYNGVINGDDVCYKVKIDNSGNIFVGGYANLTYTPDWYPRNRDFLVIKYNPDGVEQWVQTFNRFGGENNDVIYDMTIDGLSNVFATGYSATLINDGNAEGDDWATVKYNADGVQQWFAVYHNDALPEEYGETPHSIALDSEGNVIVTGWASGEWYGDALIIKYRPDGTTIWEKRYHGNGIGAEARYAGIDSLDNIYITGTRYDYDFVNDLQRNDYFALKYDSDGNEQWAQTYAENTTSSNAEVLSAKLDKSGYMYITGYSDALGDFLNFNYLTLKFNSSGILLWTMTHDGLGNVNDYPSELEIDNAGNVYVTGAEVIDAVAYTNDMVTIKYSQVFTGIHTNEKGIENELTIYPNPSTNKLMIQTNEKIKSIQCLNDLGQTFIASSGNNIVDISDLSIGMYILKVVTEKGEIISKRFMKR